MKIFLILAGCALITMAFSQTGVVQLQECSLDSAYASGVLDAKNKVQSRINYAAACDANSNFHDQLNAAYRSGYQRGSTSTAMSGASCIKNPAGNEVCGYDCKKNSFNDVRCASFPTQNCLIDRYTKKIMCGYDCLKSTNGTVYCGQFYDDNCIQDAYGIVKCGLNCRLEGGSIQCDQRLPS